jgi:hypothetical protein
LFDLKPADFHEPPKQSENGINGQKALGKGRGRPNLCSYLRLPWRGNISIGS